MHDIAVLGVGPAGALCARELTSRGADVVAIDKGRGAGGRLSTRRAGDARFDHGAQYFTVRDPALQDRSTAWAAAGAISRWEGPFGTLTPRGFVSRPPSTDRWVGTPGMNSLLKHLLQGVDVRFGARAEALHKEPDGWTVLGTNDQPLARARRLVVAVPTPQAIPLLSGHQFAEALKPVQYAPCWAAMVAAAPLDISWTGAHVEESPLAWVARNQTKPGRPTGEQWVLHASEEWSREHLEEDASEVATALVEAAQALPGLGAFVPTFLQAHRWRYALVTKPLGKPCLHEKHLTVCGDGLLGGRVEAALLSGLAAAEAVAASV